MVRQDAPAASRLGRTNASSSGDACNNTNDANSMMQRQRNDDVTTTQRRRNDDATTTQRRRDDDTTTT
jgi:hypothetical protein